MRYSNDLLYLVYGMYLLHYQMKGNIVDLNNTGLSLQHTTATDFYIVGLFGVPAACGPCIATPTDLFTIIPPTIMESC